jgi:hypothetical protein
MGPQTTNLAAWYPDLEEDDPHAKYCRCLLHQQVKQNEKLATTEGSVKLGNPYAICSASISGGSRRNIQHSVSPSTEVNVRSSLSKFGAGAHGCTTFANFEAMPDNALWAYVTMHHSSPFLQPLFDAQAQGQLTRQLVLNYLLRYQAETRQKEINKKQQSAI